MEAMLTVLSKVLVILVMMAVGYFITKKGMLTETGSREITDILLKVITPCLIVNSFISSVGDLSASSLLMAVGVSALAGILAIGTSYLAFRKEPESRKKVLRFSVSFCNCGFMGLPLVEAVVGSRGVIFASFYIAVFNFFCWTYGYRMMSGGGKIKPVALLLNPGIIGIVIGLPLYMLKVNVPALIAEPVSFFSAANTPLAMLVIGGYIARVDIKSFATDRSVYIMSALRLIAAPAFLLALLMLIRPSADLMISAVMQAAMPAAANSVLFAVQYKCDSVLASKSVAVSTVLSVITVPIFTVLAQMAAEFIGV